MLRCSKNGKICDCCDAEKDSFKDYLESQKEDILKDIEHRAYVLNNCTVHDQAYQQMLLALMLRLGSLQAYIDVKSKVTKLLD